jgi:HEPN domain/Nucleotidyltransferase domain
MCLMPPEDEQRPVGPKSAPGSVPPAADDPVLAEIVRRLVVAYHPQRVYLFGSQARGDADEDSDYDLMVIVPDDASPERRSAGAAILPTGYFRERVPLPTCSYAPIPTSRHGGISRRRCRGRSFGKAGSCMPPDPALVQDTRAWLRRAWLDIRAAEHDMKAEPPPLDDVVFHCQQAAEKALKALLAWHDVPFRKTHDLAEIG